MSFRSLVNGAVQHGVRPVGLLAIVGVAIGAGVASGPPKATTPRGFPVHSIESAPAASQPILQSVKGTLGFVPNLFGTLSDSPAALEAYATLAGIFDKTSLTPTERTIVLITASIQNECGYCVPAHTLVGKSLLNVEGSIIEAARNDRPISDPKLEALRNFVKQIGETKGDVGSDRLGAFLKAGYTRQQALEVVVGLGLKTLSNYTNRLVDQPLDDELAAFRWSGRKSK